MESSDARAPSCLRYGVALLLVLLAVAGAWNHELWTYDEPREAEIARAMYRSGNYGVGELNRRPFLDKPPLFTASVALAYRLVGHPSVLAGRLTVAAWALATLLVTAWLARRLLGPGTGLLAALILATSYRFYSISREILLDNGLATFATASIAFGAIAARDGSRGLAALAALCLAGAFLTKGIVGVGIVGLVLLVDLIVRRDKRGLATLLHPVAWVAFVVPVVVYFAALLHTAGPHAREYVVELFWNNQIGRFLGTKQQKTSDWHLYFSTWPEMLAFWVPFALGGMVHAARKRGDEALRFALAWAFVPLVVLSFSSGRARSYALPMIPAYALLIVGWWRDTIASRDMPLPARRLVAGVLSVAAAAFVALVIAIAVREPDHLDVLEGAGAAIALVAAGVWIARHRDPAFARSERAALLCALLPLAALLVYSGRAMASRLDRVRGYTTIAEEVDGVVGDRELAIFQVSNSYSGAFPFVADRSALEYDAGYDPRGEHLMAELGPVESNVALAQAGAVTVISTASRCELAVIWSATRADDAGAWHKAFVLLGRRKPGEPPRDPLDQLVPHRSP
ncbi:MAG TPA: phospholipid carrier-dependent glycosyltransferase [Planctomycetota bacterium]|nr:phospholipid carrier-dependent glycosyltransferase [Planctomycetota bacterium]